MAPRPNWKGYLKLSLVSCSIALYPATSAGERVSFNQLNKKTGNRIRYKKVDADTDEEVDPSDIIKGYQVDKTSTGRSKTTRLTRCGSRQRTPSKSTSSCRWPTLILATTTARTTSYRTIRSARTPLQ
jgi:hypothetical protein